MPSLLFLLTTIAQLNNPYGLRLHNGEIYLCDIGSHRILRVNPKTGSVSTFAGTGEKGYSGDGGPAIEAKLNEPYDLVFDRMGNVYFVDMPENALRRIDARTGILTTVAGSPQFKQPHSMALAGNSLLICDIGNNRILKVDLASGMISVFLDKLKGPRALDVDDSGRLWLVLREGNAVYRLNPDGGGIVRIAGTGEKGYAGDNGTALEAKLNGPKAIAWSSTGIYIADTENHCIRKIDERTGLITTVATGLKRPHGVIAGPGGILYIADSENNRLLRLTN